MWPVDYFGSRYWNERYWCKIGAAITIKVADRNMIIARGKDSMAARAVDAVKPKGPRIVIG